jgi:hypothetical protein
MMSTKNNNDQPLMVEGYTFERRESTPEFYADGISEAFVGMPVSKLTFHSVRGIDGGKERRVSVVQISVATPALFEICRNILAQGVVTGSMIEQGMDISKEQLKNVLKDVNVTTTPPFTRPEIKP